MVLNKIKEALSSQFGIDEAQITENTDIISDLGADSLDIVELMMILEEEYGLLITDDMISDIRTIGELTAFVENMIENQ